MLKPIRLVSFVLLILSCTTVVSAKEFTPEALYSHPIIVGTTPSDPVWSPDGKLVAFLWNEEGRRFRDLYISYFKGEIKRLTDLSELPRNEIADDSRAEWQIQEQHDLDNGVSSPVWAADSKWIYFLYRGDIFRVGIKSEKTIERLTQTEQGESNLSVSTDGRWLCYTAGNNIYVREIATGNIFQLTRDGSSDIRNGTGAYDTYLSGVFWAPDGLSLAFIQHNTSGMDHQLIPDYTTKKVTVNEQQREVASGRLPTIKLGIVSPYAPQALPHWLDLPQDEQFYLRSLDWSPDGTKLLMEVMPRLMFDRYILIAEVESGKIDTIWHEEDDKWIPRNMAKVRFGPNAESVVFCSEMSGWNHFYQIPVTGGTPTQLTSGNWEIPSGGWGGGYDWQISDDRKTIIFVSNEGNPKERHIYSLNLTNGEKQIVTEEEGWISSFSVTDDGSKAAIIYGDLETPFELYLTDTKKPKPMLRITHSQPDAFKEYTWFKPEYIEIPTSDGKTVSAKLWLPDERNLPAPLIVYIHGAGYFQNVEKSAWGYEDRFHRMLVQKGFAIVDIDYRGSSGYGRDWRVEIYKHTGGRDLDDAVDAASYCEDQGWAIPGVTGIWGWSYGGFLTNMAMFKRPDIFKVGCSVAAVDDWTNYNLEYTSQRWKDPSDDPDAYAQSSPITFAAGLEGKLLIMHGMQDDNVHVQDTIQLIDKLIRLGKHFDLQLYPRERHGFSRDESNVQVMRSIMEYFQEHLK